MACRWPSPWLLQHAGQSTASLLLRASTQRGTVPATEATEARDGPSDEEHASLECRAAPRPACRHRLGRGSAFFSPPESGGPPLDCGLSSPPIPQIGDPAKSC